MAYLLDADWVIQALDEQPTAVNTLRDLKSQPIAISAVTVGEIYDGAFNSSNPQAHFFTI